MNTVADQSLAVAAMQTDWSLSAALLGGTRTMRAAQFEYLPQWLNEADISYQRRLASATLYPAYARTIDTLSSKPFSKPVIRSNDIPAKVLPWLEDVDLEGRNIDTFSYDVLESALAYGLCGILIDYPTVQGTRSVATENAEGLRPYWVHIKPQQILGWRAARIAGKWSIEQLRLMEAVIVVDGDWGEKSIQQVRVLAPGKWQTYRQNEKNEWNEFESGVTTLKYVPFVPVYGARTGYLTGKPPLREMAHLNVKHWQSQSDQDTLLHVARVPILTIRQAGDNFKLVIGAATAVNLGDSPNAELRFVEHSGAAITAGRSSLEDLEEQMRQAGAELLVLQPGKVTATQVSTENSVSMSALQRMTKGVQDALDQALQITAEWINEKEGGGVTLFTDFGSLTMADASAQMIISAQAAGLVSRETTINELKRRGTLSAEVDADDEAEKISQEGPALGEADIDPITGDPLPELGQNENTPATPATPAAPAGSSAGTELALQSSTLQPQVLQQIPNQPPAPVQADLTAIFSALTEAMKQGMQGQNLPVSSTVPTTPVTEGQPPFDLTAIVSAIDRLQQPAIDVNALLAAIGNMRYVVNVNQAPITVEGDTITVEPPDITVNPPTVTVGAPVINLPAPEPRNTGVTFTKDLAGDISGASLTP